MNKKVKKTQIKENDMPGEDNSQESILIENRLKSKRRSLWSVFILPLLFSITFVVTIYMSTLKLDEDDPLIQSMYFLIFIFFTGSILYAFYYYFSKKRLKQKLEWEMSDEKNKIQSRGIATKSVIKDQSLTERLTQICLNNVSRNYKIIVDQAWWSFFLSAVAGIAGFLLIVLGLIISAIAKSDNMPTTTYLATGSGIMTEFISAIFFYLYNKTSSKMQNYHDSLISSQNTMLSFDIVDKTEDPNVKTEMLKLLLDSLIDRKSK